MRFSANLGFLWTEHTLPDAIRAAKRAGFDAVECHWPFEVPPADVAAALRETGLPMLGLNTRRGDVSAGENGLAALPGREDDARAAIDQAIAYAAATETRNVHVMAGFARGDAARRAFVANLRYATQAAAAQGITVLIEPLNHYDAPGYFLQYSTQARDVIEAVGADNLKLMFDCYHLQIMEGDVSRRLRALHELVGHIQIASIPDRAEPDSGELDYRYVMGVITDLGHTSPIGAEYKPSRGTDRGLGWLTRLG